MNCCFWKKGPSTFQDVLKGKLELVGPQQAALQEMLNQTELSPKDLKLLSPDLYPKWNQYCIIEENKITELHLYDLAIEDFTFLAKLSHLQEVTIRGCSISSIPDLTALDQLQELNLYDNQIKKVAQLPKLKKINLGHNQLQEIPVFSSPEGLEELELSYNQIHTIQHLDSLTDLKYLNVGHNNIAQIQGLSGLSTLERLDLSYNQITEIDHLAHLAKLQNLNLSGNRITDIGYLEEMPFLRSIYLNTNQIRQINTPTLIENCYSFQIRSNPLEFLSKPQEDFSEEDSLSYELYLAIYQKESDRNTGLRKGRAKNIRKSGTFSVNTFSGASGHIKGSIERLTGLYAVTIGKTTHSVGQVDVVASIEKGVGRVWLKGNDVLMVPKHPVRLSGYLFEVGYEEKRIKFESLDGEMQGLKYEVRIGKNRE